MVSFDEALRNLKLADEARKKQEQDRPRKEFMTQAQKAGFTLTQAKFMWDWLAKSDHEHWNGMVG